MKGNKGFTLMEMLIAIVILAVLAGIAIPSVGAYMRHARVSSATADANMLASAFNIYNTLISPPITVPASITKDDLSGLGIMPKLSNDYDEVVEWILFDDTETYLFYANVPDIE